MKSKTDDTILYIRVMASNRENHIMPTNKDHKIINLALVCKRSHKF